MEYKCYYAFKIELILPMDKFKKLHTLFHTFNKANWENFYKSDNYKELLELIIKLINDRNSPIYTTFKASQLKHTGKRKKYWAYYIFVFQKYLIHIRPFLPQVAIILLQRGERLSPIMYKFLGEDKKALDYSIGVKQNDVDWEFRCKAAYYYFVFSKKQRYDRSELYFHHSRQDSIPTMLDKITNFRNMFNEFLPFQNNKARVIFKYRQQLFPYSIVRESKTDLELYFKTKEVWKEFGSEDETVIMFRLLNKYIPNNVASELIRIIVDYTNPIET